jgi:hypothetical protein
MNSIHGPVEKGVRPEWHEFGSDLANKLVLWQIVIYTVVIMRFILDFRPEKGDLKKEESYEQSFFG